MRHIFLNCLIACLLIVTTPVSAAETYPKSTFSYELNMDYAGGDLRAIFETTQNYCETACFAEQNCRAITYNTRSNACFLKDDSYQSAPFAGAISAKLVDTDPAKRAIANIRLKRLGYLSAYEKSRAMAFRQDVAQAIATLKSHAGKLDKPNADWFIDVFTSATLDGNSNAWLAIPAALKQRAKQLPNTVARLRYYRSAAAVNAFLDAGDGETAAAVRAIIDAVSSDYGRGKDIVAATRHLHEITGQDDAAVTAARAKFGPRILDYEIETAAAKPRVCFTFSEKLAPVGIDYLDYVQTLKSDLVAEVQGHRLCMDGMRFGESFTLTMRTGLPANSGETTVKPFSYTLYIPDRAPAVRFQGNGYVLPKGETATVPVVTVNTQSLDITIYRAQERNLSPILLRELFLQPLSGYDANQMADQFGEQIWKGTAETQNDLNQEIVTALPVQQALKEFEPGLYIMTAQLPGGRRGTTPATQWFLISDIGITSFSGPDGLHILTKSLATATSLTQTKLDLISRNNKILASVETDQNGYAHFPKAALAGRAGNAPAALSAHQTKDFAFIDLTSSAFDFSDRGVEGREAPNEFDIFVTTDRGIYQPGDQVYSTVLLRNAKSTSVTDLPLTVIVYRPDGQEYNRTVLTDQGAGGRVLTLHIAPSAQLGRWSARIYLDTDDAPLSDWSFLVEDFIPERIDFTPDLPNTAITQSSPPELSITASYLYGASGSNLPLSGIIVRRTITEIPSFPGYHFGSSLAEQRVKVVSLPNGLFTDQDGMLKTRLPLPDMTSPYQPEQLKVTLQMREGSGRPVERSLTRFMEPQAPLIGIKPLFDGTVPEGAQASFEIIAVGQGMSLADLGNATWRVERIETNYQWFKIDRRWGYIPIKSREIVERGTVLINANAPAKLQIPLAWGDYELTLEAKNGGAVQLGSFRFHAGYYGSASNSDTPNRLKTGLNKDIYQRSDTVNLRITAPYDGVAQIVVLNSELVTQKTVFVQKGDVEITFDVTDSWGSGAYILTSFIQPTQAKSGRNPTRAVGVNWVPISAKDQHIDLQFDIPEMVNPNAPTTIGLTASSSQSGPIYATIAAVDLGILNITGFKAPDPQKYYFGQRKLGFEMRDLYGRLIDGFAGVDGALRSGGDGGVPNSGLGPKTETYLTLFSGLLELDENGHIDVPLNIPEFNGTMKLMAVAWSDKAVGQASQNVLVRDPVVILANAPRFLAPGDTSSLRLEIAHAYGDAGQVSLTLESSNELVLDITSKVLTLKEGAHVQVEIPLVARFVGLGEIRINLKLPNGQTLTKTVNLPVQNNDLPIVKRWDMAIAPNSSEQVATDLLNAFGNDVQLAIIPQLQAGLDIQGLVHALDTYPYGCTEQLISRAQPLLSFQGQLDDPSAATARLQQTITQIIANQSTNGSFGLWRPQSENPWLDAYATDFLVRAQKAGATVPDRVLNQALSRLKNTVNNASDFDEGGEELAYALMVLASVGKAAIGELRYYSDAKGDAFATALAQAQLGVALAAYGENDRSKAMFARAFRKLDRGKHTSFADDFGSYRRDKAAVLALAVQAGALSETAAIKRADFIRLASNGNTQEQAWALRLAAAVQNTKQGKALLNAARRYSSYDVAQGRAVIENPHSTTLNMVLTATGKPIGDIQKHTSGYKIRRSFYTVTGGKVDMSNISQNDKIVVVIKITPETKRFARLMVNDPLPAGFEIDNPHLLQSGSTASLPWLDDLIGATHSEFRKDRFLAAVDWSGTRSFKLAYVLRAISAGKFHQPAAHVTDMYRADLGGNTASGTVTVLGQ